MNELTAALANLTATMERLNMRAGLRAEPNLLPTWRTRTTVRTRTQYLRRNYTMADAAYLRTLLAVPDALTAVRAYQKAHVRVLRGKRKPIEADPDPSCPQWRDRPARHLTAREMATEQFSGRALQRELARIR